LNHRNGISGTEGDATLGRRIREMRGFDMTQAKFRRKHWHQPELSFHDGTWQGGDWSGDPASNQSGVYQECWMAADGGRL